MTVVLAKKAFPQEELIAEVSPCVAEIGDKVIATREMLERKHNVKLIGYLGQSGRKNSRDTDHKSTYLNKMRNLVIQADQLFAHFEVVAEVDPKEGTVAEYAVQDFLRNEGEKIAVDNSNIHREQRKFLQYEQTVLYAFFTLDGLQPLLNLTPGLKKYQTDGDLIDNPIEAMAAAIREFGEPINGKFDISKILNQ